MTNPFVRKLLRGVDLTALDQGRLVEAVSRTEDIAPHTVLMREGGLHDGGYVLLSGFAICHKLLTNGERQIVAYRVPGDADGLHGIHTESADYTVATLTPSTVAFISRGTIDGWLADSPGIARALWWSLLTERNYLCAALTNVGQRPGPQRLAYFLCELLSRLRAVGLERNGSFDLPFTYRDIADMLGFTEVHACRAFNRLRELGLLLNDRTSVVVSDVDGLKCFADFDLTCY
ncbi:Crp/Fnr family transcriptional regulator [Methylobacterium oryzisoli]|uniref:Crp/Fnr family transcriptional regulator n=1 Tax=Methylobacterium oryzisoli TaxID=3385502 RepID=UPI0038916410